MGIRAKDIARRHAAERFAARQEAWRRDAAEVAAFDRDYLTTDAVAVMLAVTTITLRRWRSAGRGPRYLKFGDARQSKCRYPADEVRRFMVDPAAYERTAGRPGTDAATPPA